jgi:hypothetical protein
VAAAASTSDDKIPTEKAVATAVAAAIGGLSFQAALPIGTILMYDGISWNDDYTLPGWYKCEGQTVPGYGTVPDLKNRFVIGYDAVKTSTRTKDNNDISIKLEENNIPEYAPDDHTGEFSVCDSDGKLDASNSNDNEFVQVAVPSNGGVFSVKNKMKAKSGAYAMFDNLADTGGTRGNGTASGMCETVAINATHAAFGKADPDSIVIDNRPSYYALIYIIKAK